MTHKIRKALKWIVLWSLIRAFTAKLDSWIAQPTRGTDVFDEIFLFKEQLSPKKATTSPKDLLKMDKVALMDSMC